MKKLKRFVIFKDLLSLSLFVITYLIILFITTRGGKFVLVSNTDYRLQHYLLPEYFRNLFYTTHDLFPDFSFHLGGGENIYYLSYYGLFSPIIFLSYFLPFVSMIDYLIASSFCIVLCSVFLFYFYLKKIGYSRVISFLGAFLLLCASPFIFHSHRHIMFMNYFPFLILGFYGVERFLLLRKSDLIIFSVTLMIFTSYYFSVSGIVVLFLLAIFRHYKLFSSFFSFSFCLSFVVRILCAVLIASILLFPTLYTLFSGRGGESVFSFTVFKPSFYFLYSTYSIGLTLGSFFFFLYFFFYQERRLKIFSLFLLSFSIFPIFNYILNGFLYVNGKSLIPFLPLYLLLVLDGVLLFFRKKPLFLRRIVFLYLIFSCFFMCVSVNLRDSLMRRDEYVEAKNDPISKLISDVVERDSSFYRINSSLLGKDYINRVFSSYEFKSSVYSSSYSSRYQDAFQNLFRNPMPYRNKFMISADQNFFFQSFMGEKYILTSKEQDDFWYSFKKEENGVFLYENRYALPIFYATSRNVSIEDFEKQEFPNNMLSMLGSVVSDKDTNTEPFPFEKRDVSYSLRDYSHLEYGRVGDNYQISSSDRGKMWFRVEEDLGHSFLLVHFDLLENVRCGKGSDLTISINGITNKLTCDGWKYNNQNSSFYYLLTGISDGEVILNFSRGEYFIGNLEVYAVDLEEFFLRGYDIDPMIVDKGLTKGDRVVGDISVREDSIFQMSIPYDKGFHIFVDGSATPYYLVNSSFIGFDISEGDHHIEIEYRAPYKRMGSIFSVLGLLFSFIIIYFEKRRSRGKSLAFHIV